VVIRDTEIVAQFVTFPGARPAAKQQGTMGYKQVCYEQYGEPQILIEGIMLRLIVGG
jgi:hypothetical protein